MADLSVAHQLAAWAAQSQPAQDPSALAMARNASLDLTACLTAGSRDPGVWSLIDAARDWEMKGRHLAIGTRRRHHPP